MIRKSNIPYFDKKCYREMKTPAKGLRPISANLTSVPSSNNSKYYRIKLLQLNSCVFGSELPIHLGTLDIAPQIPSLDLCFKAIFLLFFVKDYTPFSGILILCIFVGRDSTYL